MSVGYDHIDLEECKKRNIAVGNTPGVSTNDIADHTVSQTQRWAYTMRWIYQNSTNIIQNTTILFYRHHFVILDSVHCSYILMCLF